jgi:GNAT superfamily N-acetyltransferase
LWLSGLADLGHVWSAEDDAGIAVWMHPDDVADIYTHDLRVREAIKALTLDGGERHDRYWDWADARLEAGSRWWYLEGIGVRASCRRQGIATALVEHGLALAAAEGARAVVMVHEARHVAFLGRFGFEVTFEGRAPDNGPYTWVLGT